MPLFTHVGPSLRFECKSTPATLVEARRVALGWRTRAVNIRPDATTIGVGASQSSGGAEAFTSETTRSDALQPHDSEKLWSLAVTDGSRAPLPITLVATCSMPRLACNAQNARGGFDSSSHDRNLAQNRSGQDRRASRDPVWPGGRTQDGGQREVERPPRAQPSAISVLGGDRVGDRGARSSPTLKGGAERQYITVGPQSSKVAAILV